MQACESVTTDDSTDSVFKAEVKYGEDLDLEVLNDDVAYDDESNPEDDDEQALPMPTCPPMPTPVLLPTTRAWTMPAGFRIENDGRIAAPRHQFRIAALTSDGVVWGSTRDVDSWGGGAGGACHLHEIPERGLAFI